MAGDWIKMRTSLITSPKVNGIARILEQSSAVSRVLATGFNGPLSEIVTRNVTRYVTVSLLLVIWGAANEHTTDGIFHNADLSDIDDMVGVPGFGVAMESVGWASYDPENDCVILPNFNEYNVSGDERRKSGAERQRRYREKKSRNGNVTRDVTGDVTSNEREEKIREDLKDKTPLIGGGDENFDSDDFLLPAEEPQKPGYLEGVSEPIGKFTMFSGWQPSTDFRMRAASWGIALPENEYTPEQLAEFVTYWQAEGKVFHHIQWEQKFARHVTRAKQPVRQGSDAKPLDFNNTDWAKGVMS